MAWRIQVEVERQDGTLEVIGEFVKQDDGTYPPQDISREIARVLDQCFEKVTAYDRIQFWEEELPLKG